MNAIKLVILGCLAVAYAGCGGSDDEKQEDPNAGKFNAISSGLEHPTGELEASNAAELAVEFEKISATSAGGLRTQASSSQSQTIACTYGGTYGIAVSTASSSSGTAVITYDNCCYATDCCFNGGGTMYYAAQTGGAYGYCADYHLSLACVGQTASATYQGCFDTSGEWRYIVTVEGKTFTVTGSMSNGTGTLSVTAANGSYTCTYTNYSGSCSGTENFSF